MDDTIFITLRQIWSGADYIFWIIVTDFLQGAEFPLACSVFSYYITCLDIADGNPVHLLRHHTANVVQVNFCMSPIFLREI